MGLKNNTKQAIKYCKFCGEEVLLDAVICTSCGRQIETLKKGDGEQIIINNYHSAIINTNAVTGGISRRKSK